MTVRTYLGIDVGTSSARAGIFDRHGVMLGIGVESFAVMRPAEDFVEHSSNDIWRACGVAVRAALSAARLDASSIAGVGFDATCSLVVLGDDDRPVTVSPTGDDETNVIVWMDHRAKEQARRINLTGHQVLRYVGGQVSPEMETPKLLWLKEKAPSSWKRARRFFDLPDFLTYRATGSEVRSLCSTTCKWTYVESAGGWNESYFREIGLGDLVDERFVRIGHEVSPLGERAGFLTEKAATELGLVPGIPVGISIIDAHAGGLGLLGATANQESLDLDSVATRLALIGGTSTCHMAVSKEPRFIPGIWGPCGSAMVPGMWLTEGGQSATGALLDHTITSHARGADLALEAGKTGRRPSQMLNERLEQLATHVGFPAELTRDLHVLPDHHGNRSPRADPSLRGMISGLKLTDSVDSLALLYLATVQAIAYGTRHILETMNRHGYEIKTLVATGGDTKNPLFLREHADITGLPILLPREPEAVLLGSAMLGAVASGDCDSVLSAMTSMSAAASVIEPQTGAVRGYHDAKYKVFHQMHDDQLNYRSLMSATAEGSR